MPVSRQQQRANALNQADWRAEKHLLSRRFSGRGKLGAGFFADLGHAVRVGWLERKTPEWGKGVDYYRLTPKGRKYLQRRRFKAALAAFRMPEAITLTLSRAELQRQGWFSVKHVGWVDEKLVEKGYYEMSTRLRQKMNGTFFRLTADGKVWAKKALRSRMEAELRAEFRRLRAEETRSLNERIGRADKLIMAWRD
jgi:DNA-binding PadR family transcriptional regulator